jgi:fructose-1,6-bisphosphatase/inositol monophosphatase family enzyme
MSNHLRPIDIFRVLLPNLRLAANYACNIQEKVQAQPEKSQYGENFYATALTDADLTIQTTVEMTLLAYFPEIHFFGEEHEKSYNTKYFQSINLGEDLLITLDPIDGTRFYLDGFDGFSIIISVIKNNCYEGALIIQPKRETYYYAARNHGFFVGNLYEDLDYAQPLKLPLLNSQRIYLSFALSKFKSILDDQFETWCSGSDYNLDQKPAEYVDLFQGNLAGIILGHGNLIDSAVFAFMAEELGAIVTTYAGENWQPFSKVKDMKIPGLVIGYNAEIHGQLLDKINH